MFDQVESQDRSSLFPARFILSTYQEVELVLLAVAASQITLLFSFFVNQSTQVCQIAVSRYLQKKESLNGTHFLSTWLTTIIIVLLSCNEKMECEPGCLNFELTYRTMLMLLLCFFSLPPPSLFLLVRLAAVVVLLLDHGHACADDRAV